MSTASWAAHYNVVHHSQFLSRLVGDGRLRVGTRARADRDHASTTRATWRATTA